VCSRLRYSSNGSIIGDALEIPLCTLLVSHTPLRAQCQHTILLHAFGPLYTHCAPGPRCAIMPASTLVVQRYRAPGTAWSNLLSCGLRGWFRSLWRGFRGLGDVTSALAYLSKSRWCVCMRALTDLGGCLGWIGFLGGRGLWCRGRVRAIITAAANTCYDVRLARYQSMLVCRSLVVSIEAH
jgi:hypothetical protein